MPIVAKFYVAINHELHVVKILLKFIEKTSKLHLWRHGGLWCCRVSLDLFLNCGEFILKFRFIESM